MDAKVLLPIVASVALMLALQAGVWYLWVDMAQTSIEAPLKQLLLTRSLRANHVLNNTLQQISLVPDVLCKCALLCPSGRLTKCAVNSVAASVNNEIADLSTPYATSFTPYEFTASGNVTSLIVTKPCDLISYMAGLQQVTEPIDVQWESLC